MVDVIIPVYRPDEKLEKLIEKLNQQTVEPAHIFFMQTMTEDEAEDTRVRKILERSKHGTIVPIDKLKFDHGGTRNKGARMSEAEFMLFMTQDAVPEDPVLIEKLLQAVQQKDTIAAAYGRQLPDDKVGVIETYTRQFNYPEESLIKGKEDLSRLGIKTYFCSNVCAAYKRSVYLELGGFTKKTIFNEDMIFAAGAMERGYGVFYSAGARVIHSHNYSGIQQFHRNFDLAVSQADHPEVFSGIRSEGEGIRMVKQTAAFLVKSGKAYLIPKLIYTSGCKCLGFLMGKRYRRLPRPVVLWCTMNKAYWGNKAGSNLVL